MAFKEENSINFDKLEEELQAAVDADAKYWRENDAKFRAIEQKVATYDDFKDIVSAAHLKPLDKGDKIDDRFMQPWNMHASKNKPSPSQPKEIPSVKEEKKLPKNGHEFNIHWRRLCKSDKDKYQYLTGFEADQLGQIFKAEVSFGLLGEFINVLGDYQEEDVDKIINILDTLSHVKRFNLSIDFLSSSEKENCCKLFSKLKKSIHNSQNVDKLGMLEKSYGIVDSS